MSYFSPSLGPPVLNVEGCPRCPTSSPHPHPGLLLPGAHRDCPLKPPGHFSPPSLHGSGVWSLQPGLGPGHEGFVATWIGTASKFPSIRDLSTPNEPPSVLVGAHFQLPGVAGFLLPQKPGGSPPLALTHHLSGLVGCGVPISLDLVTD